MKILDILGDMVATEIYIYLKLILMYSYLEYKCI